MATDVRKMKVQVRGGTIALPPELLERYHLHDGDEVEVVSEVGCLRIRKPSRRDLSQFVGIAMKQGLPQTTDEYMREIRPR